MNEFILEIVNATNGQSIGREQLANRYTFDFYRTLLKHRASNTDVSVPFIHGTSQNAMFWLKDVVDFEEKDNVLEISIRHLNVVSTQGERTQIHLDKQS